jgi:aspartate/methionine/tyrosine aminotransferase
MAFSQRARELEAQGHRVVSLSLGEPDFGAPASVRQAMCDAMDGQPLPYTSAMGLPALREAISGFYRDRHGVEIDPARIAITSGASGALLLATAATVDPGDEVILADPCYPCNRELVTSFGGTVVLIPTSAATRYQLDAESVERAWSPRTRGVMVATPSNPTGTSIPFSQLAAICDLARAREAWRIVDEIYLELSDPGPRRHPGPHRGGDRSRCHRHLQLLEVLRDDRLASRLGDPAREPGAGRRATRDELLPVGLQSRPAGGPGLLHPGHPGGLRTAAPGAAGTTASGPRRARPDRPARCR